MRVFMALLLPYTILSHSQAQNQALSERDKNVISIEGEFVVLAGNFSMNYERILSTGKKSDLGLRAGMIKSGIQSIRLQNSALDSCGPAEWECAWDWQRLLIKRMAEATCGPGRLSIWDTVSVSE